MRLIVIKNDYGKEQQMLQIAEGIQVDDVQDVLIINWFAERHSKELIEPFYLPKEIKFMDSGEVYLPLERSNNVHEQVQSWLNRQAHLQNKKQSEGFKKHFHYVYRAGLPNPSRYIDSLQEEE